MLGNACKHVKLFHFHRVASKMHHRGKRRVKTLYANITGELRKEMWDARKTRLRTSSRASTKKKRQAWEQVRSMEVVRGCNDVRDCHHGKDINISNTNTRTPHTGTTRSLPKKKTMPHRRAGRSRRRRSKKG